MQDGKRILTGWGRLTLVLAMAVLAGCGDAQKRQAGKSLREATDQARRLYSQSLKLLSNPSTNENVLPDSLDPKALKYLDEAQNLLTASISKNYDALKGNPSDAPTAEAGIAKMMLAMIDRLRAQYYIWNFDQIVAQSDTAMGALQRKLDRVQVCSILLKTSETYATLSDADVKKALNDTEQNKAKLDETISALKKQIQEKETRIAEKKKSIEERSSKAIALRTEKTLTRGMESQKKLEEALNIESGIHDTRNEIQKMEGELIPEQTQLGSAEIRLMEAQTIISALKDIRLKRENGVKDITKTIEERKAEFVEACKDVSASLTELDSLASQVAELAQKAQASLLRASNTIDGALRFKLIDDDKKATSLSEWAHVKAAEGALQRSIVSLRSSMKNSTDHLTHTWEGLHKDKPNQPDASGVTVFLDATSHAQESAQASYQKAVELWDQAVKAAPREDNWQYKREQVVGLLDYARILDQAGHANEAAVFRNQALKTFEEIEDAAKRAGKPASIVALKKFVLEETGS